MGCNGICTRHPVPEGYATYIRSRRCTECRHWFKPETIICPCCNMLLRSKPRCKKQCKNFNYHQKFEKIPWILAK